MKRPITLVVTVLAFLVFHPVSHGQAPARPAADLPARVAALESALREARAQQGTLSALAQDLQTQVTHLRQQLAQADRRAGAVADLDRMVAALEARIRTLSAELERSRQARLAGAGAATPGRFRAGYENGFFVASRDGRYRLTVGGLLRTVASVGEVVGASSLLEPAGRVDRVALTLPQAMLILDGNVFSTKLGFHLEAQLGNSAWAKLLDLFLTYRPCRWFGIAAGQMPVGFSRQSDLWPYELLFSSGTEAVGAFGMDRELGLRLTFYQWQDRLYEEVSLWNGQGTSVMSSAAELSLMAQLRVGLAPLGPVPDTEGDFRTGDRPLRMLVTAAYFYTPMPTARTEALVSIRETLRVHQAGAHASAYWAGAYLAGELFFRYADLHSTDPAAARRTRNWGGYVQASYTFRRAWLALAARYGYSEPVPYYRGMLLQPITDWSSTMPGAADPAERAHEAALTLVWHPFRPFLRIGLEYQWHLELDYPLGTDRKGQRQVHLANLWAQLRF